jgi:beta-phosphoglucomutase-like phosphatase (HAD superfamily)
VVASLPAGTFAALVVGDEVANGKPHPESYLTAARMLGVDPRGCVAIEDSATGAASAQAAGCHVVAVPNHVPVPEADNRTLLSTLEGVRLADLEGMLLSAGSRSR